MVTDCPSVSAKIIRSFLLDSVSSWALTTNIVQSARTIAKKDIFGEPSVNVTYAEALRDKLVAAGHVCELVFSTQDEIMKAIKKVVIKDEICRRMHKTPLDPVLTKKQQRHYFNEWQANGRRKTRFS